ncbi:ELWxxDGT repeat protein [Cesiribacter sp. SM1]|uniref:ELWxxDGT repeat protein n=1 Tax=Cesiribacter sp. SM1 TaxID=2861196 RepID=UPI001CD78EF9|nr:ELWxxDGT repeat protein [Cesiribacter sp. SM1]
MQKALPFLFLLYFIAFGLNAQTQLTNITSQAGDKGSRPMKFIELNNMLFFIAGTTTEGRELWVSDGTAANTRLLKDIYPGWESGLDSNLEQGYAILNDKLYFIANDGEHGNQIWATDGTPEGTHRITDQPILNYLKLAVAGDYLYFLVMENDGLQVWKSDGTRQGTQLVKGGIDYWNGPSFLGEADGHLLFTFQPNEKNYSRVWRSDGTEAGTYPITEGVDGNGATPAGTTGLTQYIEYKGDLYFVAKSSDIFSDPVNVGIVKTSPDKKSVISVKAVHEGSYALINFADVALVNNKLYFSFFERENNHFFIWESDGTTEGTKKIYDEHSSSFFMPSNISTDGRHLVFTGKSTEGSTALLKMDLENYDLTEVKQFDTESIPPSPYTSFKGNVITKTADDYFHIALTTSSTTPRSESWFSDLTPENTVKSNELDNLWEIKVFNEHVYFEGHNDETGEELWKTDGHFSKLELLANINTTKYGFMDHTSDFSEVAVLGDKIIFRAYDGHSGSELWVYDTSNDDYYLLKDILEGEKSALPSDFFKFKDQLFFVANSKEHGRELWRTDGTPAGTLLLQDLFPGTASSEPYLFMPLKDKLYFIANTDYHTHLYATDGITVASIKDLGKYPWPGIIHFWKSVASDDAIYFTADGFKGDMLWTSDGTTEGTTPVKDFFAIDHLTAMNGKLFFSAAEDYGLERELWISDGSEAGTKPFKDSGEASFISPTNLYAYEDLLIFTATDKTGSALWRTDGTAEETYKIAAIKTAPSLYYNRADFTLLNGVLFFSAYDASHGTELWKTDGTAEGTAIVMDIHEGATGSFPQHLHSNREHLYFTAYTPEGGQEVWVSRGTAATTQLLYDLNAGSTGTRPSNYMFVNNELYFIAESVDAAGRQLWKGESKVTGIDEPDTNELLTLYPNPASDFINIEGGQHQFQSIKIYNLIGQSIISLPRTDRVYVGDLSPGIYLLVTESASQKHIVRFIKE